MACADRATAEAEQYLRDELKYNRDHSIDPADNEIIERLLGNTEIMRPLYRELWGALHSARARETVLEQLIKVAVVAHPKRTRGLRDEKKLAQKLNDKIGGSVDGLRRLAALLRERDTDCSAVDAISLPHVVELLGLAAQQSQDRFKPHLFESRLAPRLDPLAGAFDRKYWPTVDELLLALAEALSCSTDPESPPEVYPPPLDKAINARSHSEADFTRALYAAIEDLKRDVRHGIPRDFRLTSGSVDCFSSVVLGHEWAPGTNAKRRSRSTSKRKDSSRGKSE